ncbi:MAG TPA: hypothetical protein VFI25_03450 [Planctomycetota bacterium]|nr:hypothetical protein [Planctomycetota bacterium]
MNPPGAGRRVAYGEGWVLLAGMAVAAAALLGMWGIGSRGSLRALAGMAAVYAAVRLAIAPAAAAFTRRLRRGGR